MSRFMNVGIKKVQLYQMQITGKIQVFVRNIHIQHILTGEGTYLPDMKGYHNGLPLAHIEGLMLFQWISQHEEGR